MTTYPDDRYRWWAGADEERLTVGPCTTRDDAIREAIKNETYTELEPDVENSGWRIKIHLCECVRLEVSDMEVDGQRVLEILEDRYEDFSFEDPLFSNVTADQAKSLGDALTAVLHAWARHHEITFPSWCFQGERHAEDVVLHPVPEESS